MLKEELLTELTETMQALQTVEEQIALAPAGTLAICSERGKTRYYQISPVDNRKTYLNRSNINIARLLAQKDYCLKAVSLLKERELAIRNLLFALQSYRPETIFESYDEERQHLIEPLFLSDEQFVSRWINDPCAHKPIEPTPFTTQAGEFVRSKSELIIANELFDLEIPYKYERSLELGPQLKVHPDFTVLNKRSRRTLYWEHFGMMDDPEYSAKALKKIEAYEASGIYPGHGLILTFESSKHPLGTAQIKGVIQEYLL